MMLNQIQVFMPLMVMAILLFAFNEQVKGENLPHIHHQHRRMVQKYASSGVIISPDVGGINSAEICNSFKLYRYGSNIINRLGTDCACYSTDSGYNVTCQDKMAHCYDSACAIHNNGQYQIGFSRDDKVLLTYDKFCNKYISGFNGTQFCQIEDYTKGARSHQIILNNQGCADVREEKCQVYSDGSYTLGLQVDCRNLGTEKIMNTCDKSTLQGTGVFQHYFSFDGTFTVASSAYSDIIVTSVLSVACFVSTLLFVF